MPESRVTVVQDNLRQYLEDAVPHSPRRDADQPLRNGSSLSCRAAVTIFQDQVTSRLLDVTARELKKDDQSYYTIAAPATSRTRCSAPCSR